MSNTSQPDIMAIILKYHVDVEIRRIALYKMCTRPHMCQDQLYTALLSFPELFMKEAVL